jgi:hypothetical protein
MVPRTGYRALAATTAPERQDKLSWNKGRADAMRGAPSNWPKGLDELAYSNGYIEGEVQRAKHPLHVNAR